jgi:hypothetical protein
MSAYVPNKAHIAALVRVGMAGPTGRVVSPDTAWHRLSWYAGDPRSIAYTGDHAAYFGALEAMRRTLDHETAQRVGRMLTDAVVASVKHRYPDDSDDTLPGPNDHYWTDPSLTFDYQRARPLTAIEALKAISGYEYQACELPEWDGSEAQRFCETLRDALINALPGYRDAATWDIEEPVHA